MSVDLSKIPVWVTRTHPSAEASAKALKHAGFTPILGPLLTVQASSTPNAAPPEGAALLFTSPNGVRAFTALTDRRHWRVYCVGDATANLAMKHGFDDVINASGDVDDLAALVAGDKPEHSVHYSGVHVAGDLVGALTAAGISAERRIIYAAYPVATLPEAAVRALEGHKRLAVLFYSPKGAQTFTALMKQSGQVHRSKDMIAISLSAKIDACLGDAVFSSRHIAGRPDEEALFSALEKALQSA